MVAALLVGCGEDAPATEGGEAGDATVEDGGDAADVPEWVEPTYEYSGSSTDDGTVLNIYCWNDEFYNRVKDHCPGFEAGEKDEATGNLSGTWNGTPVVFYITANADNAYQNNLDTHLAAQESASAEDKIDIFLVEADYAVKYIDSNASLTLADVGITDADVADQYAYTQTIVTDMHGNLKASSWQGAPGVLAYNRPVALEVLGSDDPVEVQKAVADWKTFNETAAKMQEAGYNMVSSVYDTYRVYSNNVTSKWVENGVINVDANIKAWVDDSMAMVEAGTAGTHDLWSPEWNEGFYPDGKVFCYFGPAWLVNFCMAADQEGSVANTGDWGAVAGPQTFYWGGTWLVAANGTDNVSLVKDMILTMTTDDAVMKEIVTVDLDYVNNKSVIDEMVNSDYESPVFGGQNPYPLYAENVDAIDLSNLCKYDQGCNEAFQKCMKDYFLGNKTYEEAYEDFVKEVIIKYPELEAYN
jgi:hypothetical protein